MLLSAGVGATPCIASLRALLSAGNYSQGTVVYLHYSRSINSIPFFQELLELLADQQDQDDSDGNNRLLPFKLVVALAITRADKGRVQRVAERLGGVYLQGPGGGCGSAGEMGGDEGRIRRVMERGGLLMWAGRCMRPIEYIYNTKGWSEKTTDSDSSSCGWGAGYVCGAETFMEEVTATLARCGMPSDRIMTESFTY